MSPCKRSANIIICLFVCCCCFAVVLVVVFVKLSGVQTLYMLRCLRSTNTTLSNTATYKSRIYMPQCRRPADLNANNRSNKAAYVPHRYYYGLGATARSANANNCSE